jgi:ketosteroid isomerase-like protein
MTTAQTDLTTARIRNEEIWRTSAEHLYAHQLEDFLAYWSDDARYEGAYTVAGQPVVVEGREALAQMFGGLLAAMTTITIKDFTFHQTDDPEVAFIEERMVSEVADGTTYENRFAIRVRFRDGRIVEMLDYFGQEAHTDLILRLGAGA